ncbi:MAG TPA: isopentenyl-diphosphate Delta-isomerase [Chryseolinea sp.]|nr:isopentenyl-diphosphate Delta-isomerase [Chryseolinea sp.]
MERVILVDAKDNVIGTMEKLEAHRKGVLHRAFSILIFNSKGEVLLQKRSKNKYHSGGLWTNACCSHPMPHESMSEATRKRLKHEMGIDLQPQFAYKFVYKKHLDKDLIEHEFDHVFIGKYDGVPSTNLEEVEDWKFIDIASLRQDLELHPHAYTEWFKLIMNHQELKEIPA